MSKYQVVGIGNAVSDVISHADDTFLDHMGIEKGIMQLVERDRAGVLYAAMQDRTETPGGSVANTLAGLGTLGVKTAFIGRVADDAIGRRYAEVTQSEGTDFPNPPVTDAALPTSRSMIFVSPDGERSMNTYLGISQDVSPADVDPDVAGDCDVLFLEGYLFDKDPGKEAFFKAADLARAAGARAGISLSDPFCVDRHRADFRALISGPMDYVICNEDELKSLYQTDDLDTVLAAASEECGLVVCTRSGDGVAIQAGGERTDVPVVSVVPVDSTGAGDQFAAGFLYGLTTGHDMETCGRMGCIAAGEVISHIGPRPEADLYALFRKAGLV
ncbi:adenosine kinase [Pseudaestuariivita atlantica]|uniref:Adenosine kinase n=1 Tax=Pseudaestuariivita atlantica TaxID=1317121 RepID=A0A0L1JNL1_9RHOB|nr:adenosine kinase [Pseudaestuariivita atlantica]KNG93360.1 adenosine kinase [Pseudaestuariivita atlantica]